ncbi:hypothetical protein SLS58_009206 [Diplodia intermedia]|uniref:Uncharacterized protein n=1 Tax=Diplodia intermedia TaxID=856260 RepID=A0ABR3TE22_9PEZI
MSQSRMNPDTQINPEIVGDQVLTPDFAIDLFTSYQREYPHLAFLVQRQPLQQVQQGQQEEEDVDDASSSYGTVTTEDLSSEESSSPNSGDNATNPPFMANGPNVPQQPQQSQQPQQPQQEEAHDSNAMETETGNGAKREHDQTDGESNGSTPQIKKEKLQ